MSLFASHFTVSSPDRPSGRTELRLSFPHISIPMEATMVAPLEEIFFSTKILWIDHRGAHILGFLISFLTHVLYFTLFIPILLYSVSMICWSKLLLFFAHIFTPWKVFVMSYLGLTYISFNATADRSSWKSLSPLFVKTSIFSPYQILRTL